MGSQKTQAPLWGAQAQNWADYQEATVKPMFEAMISAIHIHGDFALLDVGCGSGMLCGMAVRRGGTVTGLDATEELISIAKERVPDATFVVGEMEELPFANDSFTYVVGMNSFQYAANPTNALKEAYRVLNKDGQLIIAIWGKAQLCQTGIPLKALGSLSPPPPPGTPGPFALSEDGALEALVSSAGFNSGRRIDVNCPFDYKDLDAALKGLLSSGPAQKAIMATSYEKAAETLTTALAPFETIDGGYLMKNVFTYLVATK